MWDRYPCRSYWYFSPVVAWRFRELAILAVREALVGYLAYAGNVAATPVTVLCSMRGRQSTSTGFKPADEYG